MSDIGGADGLLSIQVALNHPIFIGTTIDCPRVEPLAKAKIAKFNMQSRIDE